MDDFLGHIAIKRSSPKQPRQLHLGRAGDDHDAVTEGFTTGFIQKWNVSEEKIGRITMGLRFSAPLAANARMENLFERLLFGRAFEHYGPKGPAIQASTGKNSGAKLAPELLLYLLVQIDEVTRRLIGIKKFRIRQELAQAIAKGCLAGGNPARNSNGRHYFFRRTSQRVAACTKSKYDSTPIFLFMRAKYSWTVFGLMSRTE